MSVNLSRVRMMESVSRDPAPVSTEFCLNWTQISPLSMRRVTCATAALDLQVTVIYT